VSVDARGGELRVGVSERTTLADEQAVTTTLDKTQAKTTRLRRLTETCTMSALHRHHGVTRGAVIGPRQNRMIPIGPGCLPAMWVLDAALRSHNMMSDGPT
jgi:hypothetical protein